ncbi:MAG TPA: hypothetical protein VL588_12340 [Bdellovibrionota bacterium]|nr:hypothetical protein [Bdellovibrionota bacterium]
MALLLLHLGLTWFLCGFAWCVAVSHYPLLREVPREVFVELHRSHRQRTSPIVGFLMTVELGTGAALLMQEPSAVGDTVAAVALGLNVLIWVTTGLAATPKHRQLEDGFDGPAFQALTQAQWLRTLLWSARCGLLTWGWLSLAH